MPGVVAAASVFGTVHLSACGGAWGACHALTTAHPTLTSRGHIPGPCRRLVNLTSAGGGGRAMGAKAPAAGYKSLLPGSPKRRGRKVST